MVDGYTLEKIDYGNNKKRFNSYGDIIGKSKMMEEVYSMIEDFSEVNYPVFITGETGTGKELAARQIHKLYKENGNREKGSMAPFVAVNCSAIPETLLESELFGHEKNAFTGAKSKKPGKFLIAYDGTIFLDEIGKAPITTQNKILRVLQEGEFEPLGWKGGEPLKTNARVIAATNDYSDPDKIIRDLFYRLNVLSLHVPSLAERHGDFPLLANHFLYKHNEEQGTDFRFSDPALKYLEELDWKGHIRELENSIKLLATRMKENVIEIKHINGILKRYTPQTFDLGSEISIKNRKDPYSFELTLQPNMNLKQIQNLVSKVIEKRVIGDTLNETNWNKRKAARILKISYKALFYKAEEHGLVNPNRLERVRDEDREVIIAALKNNKGNIRASVKETGFTHHYFRDARIKFGIDSSSFK